MRELSLVGLSADGTSLVLAEGNDRFTVRIDERLAAASRGDRLRMGQLQIELESSLRPAEIQARIRAGASAEDVAAVAGVPVERIRRYEGPVLAEREHIASAARTTPVRRRENSPNESVRLLGDVVEARLSAAGIAPDTALWDSFRRDDGCWEVTLDHGGPEDPTRATWVFDPRRRVLRADDDQARWLSDESAPAARPASRPEPRTEPAPTGRAARRLSAVPSVPRAANASTSFELPAPVVPPEPGDDVDEPAATALPLDEPAHAAPSRDEEPSVRRDSPLGGPVEPRRVVEPFPAEPDLPRAPEPVVAPAAEAQATDAPDDAAPAPTGEPAPRPARTAARGRRAAVPSWDDIVFGARKRD